MNRNEAFLLMNDTTLRFVTGLTVFVANVLDTMEQYSTNSCRSTFAHLGVSHCDMAAAQCSVLS